MRWPWQRYADNASPDADASMVHAQRAAQDARALAERATRAADALEATRIRNHFAAAVEQSIRRS
jgi:hypothetical protein